MAEGKAPDERGAADSTGDQRLNVTIFALIALIGGGNPVGVSIVVDELDPLWAAAVRFLAAGAIFAVGMAVMRVPMPRGSALLGSVAYGVMSFFAAFALLFWGFLETPPGTGQIIVALVPLVTIFLAAAHGLERVRLRPVLGALIALIGLAFLIGDRIQADVPLPSLLAVVAGSIFLAESGVILKVTPRTHPAATNAIGMLAGGALLLPVSAVIGDAWRLPSQPDTWAAMAFLVLGGSVAVFSLFVFLLERWSVSAVSYTLLLQPLPTLVYSAILTDEPLTLALLVGGAIMLIGVYIGAFASPAQPPVEERAPAV